ncbi:MAG: ImmA/IrrE family metallo-endopeptidase [Clostridiales bacterium]|nr:ImmA/IrrE family metallo-endopeptidase [Clostridiales bacterium]
MKSELELNSDAIMLRKKWGQDSETPVDIFALTRLQPKVTLVNIKMDADISGVCIRDKASIVIGINTDMSWGRQRYTLAHELYHGFIDETDATYICNKQFDNGKPVVEKEADEFASFFLIPYEALAQYDRNMIKNNWSDEEVIIAEQFFQISHQALLIRLVKNEFISGDRYEELKQLAVTGKAVNLGFSTALYRRSEDEDRYGCTGEYIRKIQQAYERGLIGAGKRRELLLDGFSLGIDALGQSEGIVGDD